MQHGLCPRSLALGGRRQLENRAPIASPAACRCSVERALIVGDQASEDGGVTVAAASEIVQHGLCPRSLALGGRRQLENRAIAIASTAIRCAVKRALIVEDQGRPGFVPVAATRLGAEVIEHGRCPSRCALGGRGQPESCARIASPTSTRCAVERALLVEDQASLAGSETAAGGVSLKTVPLPYVVP